MKSGDVCLKWKGREGKKASDSLAFVPNLFWRNVEVVSAPPPLYLNFYRKLAMIAKPSVGKGC